MARHDQKPRNIERSWVCATCQLGQHEKCVDEIRTQVFGKEVVQICKCKHNVISTELNGVIHERPLGV